MLVGEPVVVAGRGEAVSEVAPLGLQVVDPSSEHEVLAGHSDSVLLAPAGLQVSNLTEEFGDLLALSPDLAVRSLEGVFAVQRYLGQS